jgi:hypothetical protein
VFQIVIDAKGNEIAEACLHAPAIVSLEWRGDGGVYFRIAAIDVE